MKKTKKPRRPLEERAEKAVEKRNLAVAEQNAMPSIFTLLKPGKSEEWIASLEPPEIAVSPEDEDATRDVLAAAVQEWADRHEGEEDPPPFVVRPDFAKFGPAFTALLGGVVRGHKQDDWMKASGISWSRAQMFARVDKHGFGLLWATAWKMRDESSSRRVHEKAVNRALDGDSVPLLGRVDKDRDGIIGERTQFSDRLTEYLIEETKPKDERVSAPLVDASTRTTQVVGQQIVYNLPELPGWLTSPAQSSEKKMAKIEDAKVVGP